MNVVKELRIRKHLLQKEISMALDVAQPTVSEWEHGKKDPSGENLEKLAEFFGVSTLVVQGLAPIPGEPPFNMEEEDQELWRMREAARRNPNRKALFDLAKNASDKDVEQISAIISAIRSTNPEFYDGNEEA